MKVLLEIKDDKAPSLLEVLNGLSYVKTKPLTDSKAEFLEELREAVEEVRMIKAGKQKGRPAKELIDEL